MTVATPNKAPLTIDADLGKRIFVDLNADETEPSAQRFKEFVVSMGGTVLALSNFGETGVSVSAYTRRPYQLVTGAHDRGTAVKAGDESPTRRTSHLALSVGDREAHCEREVDRTVLPNSTPCRGPLVDPRAVERPMDCAAAVSLEEDGVCMFTETFGSGRRE